MKRFATLNHTFFLCVQKKDISPVVNAMIDSLCQVYPQTHYFEAPWVEKMMAYTMELLPSSMTDPFVSLFQFYLFPLLGRIM